MFITINIKNMVCNRCIMVVRSELEKLGFEVVSIKLGEVIVDKNPSEEQLKTLANALEAMGFEIIDDKKKKIIEKIKNTLIELVHYQNNDTKVNISDLLKDQLHLDYNYLSTLFSEVEGTTIEQYYIAQKIERVKELLVYNELTLSEIAYQLNYSSVAYLSNQFKKVTGFSPSQFKKLKKITRKGLDKV